MKRNGKTKGLIKKELLERLREPCALSGAGTVLQQESEVERIILDVPLTREGISALAAAASKGPFIKMTAARRALLPSWRSFEGKKVSEGSGSIEDSPASRCAAFLPECPDIPVQVVGAMSMEYMVHTVAAGGLSASAMSRAAERIVDVLETSKKATDVRLACEAIWLGKWSEDERRKMIRAVVSADERHGMKHCAYLLSKKGFDEESYDALFSAATEKGNPESCAAAAGNASEHGWLQSVVDAVMEGSDSRAAGKLALLLDGREREAIVSSLSESDLDGMGCSYFLRSGDVSDFEEEILVDRLETAGCAEALVEAALYANLSPGATARIFRLIPEEDPAGHVLVDAVETLFPENISEKLPFIASALSEIHPGLWDFSSPGMTKLGVLLKEGFYDLLEKSDPLDPPNALFGWAQLVLSKRGGELEALDGGKSRTEEEKRILFEKLMTMMNSVEESSDIPVL